MLGCIHSYSDPHLGACGPRITGWKHLQPRVKINLLSFKLFVSIKRQVTEVSPYAPISRLTRQYEQRYRVVAIGAGYWKRCPAHVQGLEKLLYKLWYANSPGDLHFKICPPLRRPHLGNVPFKGRIDTSHGHLADVFISFSSVAHSESHHIHSVENDSAGSYTDSNRESRNNHKLLLLEKCQVGLHGPFFPGRFG